MLTKTVAILFVLMLSGLAFSQNPPVEPGVSQTLARWRAERYSNVRYKLNLTLEKMSPVLKGTIEIRVNVSEPGAAATAAVTSAPSAGAGGAVAPIILDWRKIRGNEYLSMISNVSLNGRELRSPPVTAGGTDIAGSAFQEFNEHLIFRDGVVAGENVIKLDFTSPILTSGSAITRYIDKEDGSEYIYSLFVPSDASTAFPVFDQPDLKARFELSCSIPAGWKFETNTNVDVASSQFPLCARAGNCDERYVFLETKPISTYVFAFAAGPWVEFNDASGTGGNPSSSEGAPRVNGPKGTLPTGRVSASDAGLQSHIYVRKSQAGKFKAHAAEVFRLNREGIKFLEEYFDYKFPFPKYDIVLIPEFPFGGMEHAGATFLRESAVIFPSEPTANDYISRATTMFHEAAHQWFGDTVTMRWFDDLWLKEGFAEFMAYKTLERVMPQYNAWKAFYERNKPLAYATDSTRGTTPIYQEIPNLSAAKSAYGNIVYRKAPSFLRQAEFYLGPEKFQTAVRAFLKKHEYSNAEWKDLAYEFRNASWDRTVSAGSAADAEPYWTDNWIRNRGLPTIRISRRENDSYEFVVNQINTFGDDVFWKEKVKFLVISQNGNRETWDIALDNSISGIAKAKSIVSARMRAGGYASLVFPNYQDYGYGIFLLDDKSRDYVLKNIQNEKDDFLRSMMWGALWDSVREAELDPREYVELAIKNIGVEKDELTIQSILGRVSTAMTYYVSEPPAEAGGSDLSARLENVLIEKMRTAPTLGRRITFYRAFLNIASTGNARTVLKEVLSGKFVIEGFNCRGETCGIPQKPTGIPEPATQAEQSQDRPFMADNRGASLYVLRTKDKFDIVTKLAILNDPDAPRLLADLEKAETGDDAKRYAYAAKAAFPTKENSERFWNDFVGNKDTSESWIEAAFGPFNSPRHADLSLPYLERALAELPNLKRSRKIFFVNGWLSAFIGGQKSQEALDIVNKFLAYNPNLDRDLRLKILENVDVVERAVKIRAKWKK